MVLQSLKNDSGNPAFLPTHSRPAKVDREAFKAVGPAAIGDVAPGVFRPPEAYVAGLLVGESVGNTRGSESFPTIHLCTSLIYCSAGTFTGSFMLFNHVYV